MTPRGGPRKAGTPSGPTVDLDDEAARAPAIVGRKAAVLARLRADGERVPAGLVVLPGADPHQAAARVVGRFGDDPVAVRSSSVAEDLAGSSFAGQYRTELGVVGAEAIARAIGTVRSSAASTTAQGHADTVASMPVLIMPMLAPDAAGVAFSRNPVTGEDEAIVEAVPGLGEGLMSGEVTPQRFVCRGLAQPEEAEGPGATAITVERAAEVAALAIRLAERFGAPQDVEWAIEDGQLHLLQTRPITALPIHPAIDVPAPRETWVRADENYTKPVRPLELSVWAPRLEASTRAAYAELGAPVESMRYRSIGGWMYARFVPPMDQGKDDQASPPAWVFGLMLRLVPAMRRMMRTAAEMWASDLSTRAADRWDDGGRAAMRARTRELRGVDRAALGDPELVGYLTDVLDHLQVASDVHARLWGLGTALPSGHLGVVCERLLGWGPTETLRLLQGFTDVADAADDLDALVDALVRDPRTVQLLRDDPAAILGDPGSAGQALRAHLDRHGHQMVGMDLGHPTWAEDPRPLLAMIAARMDRRDVIREDPRVTARVAEERARRELVDRPEDLATFEDALARARRGIGYGDDTEADVLEAFALVRYAVMEAGRRLAASGALERPDDVLFLDEDELFAALRGGRVTADLDRRRGEYLWAKGHQGPKRYGPQPTAFPSMRWAPKGARPFLEAMVWVMDRMTPTPVTEPAPDGVLVGTPASPGRATGTVRVIRDPSEFPRIQPDDVLVCPCTVAAWSVVFPLVSAIVTEVGGPLSHPGILAREFGVPAVLGVDDATTRLYDGLRVTVDGTAGRVEMVAGPQPVLEAAVGSR